MSKTTRITIKNEHGTTTKVLPEQGLSAEQLMLDGIQPVVLAAGYFVRVVPAETLDDIDPAEPNPRPTLPVGERAAMRFLSTRVKDNVNAAVSASRVIELLTGIAAGTPRFRQVIEEYAE